MLSHYLMPFWTVWPGSGMKLELLVPRLTWSGMLQVVKNQVHPVTQERRLPTLSPALVNKEVNSVHVAINLKY